MKIYQSLWDHDLEINVDQLTVIGIDEAGRGPLAGNVVAAAVVLDLTHPIPGIRDSKKIPEAKREELFSEILESAKQVGVGECTPGEIDEFNILQATFRAMKKALLKVKVESPMILVDGNHKIPHLPDHLAPRQRCLIKGDSLSASIAAASIIAKVTRDRQMLELDKQHPEYGFASNKGYGSKMHIEAILKNGLTPAHRRSFKPKALTQTSLF